MFTAFALDQFRWLMMYAGATAEAKLRMIWSIIVLMAYPSRQPQCPSPDQRIL